MQVKDQKVLVLAITRSQVQWCCLLNNQHDEAQGVQFEDTISYFPEVGQFPAEGSELTVLAQCESPEKILEDSYPLCGWDVFPEGQCDDFQLFPPGRSPARKDSPRSQMLYKVTQNGISGRQRTWTLKNWEGEPPLGRNIFRHLMESADH